ncbi:hypothetical protein [Janthinobacterium sp. CG3]|uniref:hypothetical protein n=1 Tax=Janthinobacterium sp. CG3 TaxID=1075768 RepID=UPI00034DB90C|nr:hypothetical protein [Janthinobacterium sp. CG3]
MDAHAHTGKHQRDQRRQRQFSLAGKCGGVFNMSGRQKEFDGLQMRGKIVEQCGKGHGGQ